MLYPHHDSVAVYIDRLGNEYNMLRYYLSEKDNFESSQLLVDKFSQVWWPKCKAGVSLGNPSYRK